MAAAALTGAVINVGTLGAGLAQSTSLLSQLEAQASRVQFIQEGIGCVFQFDATISESHDLQSQPTAFPLEDGTVITDHIVQAPVAVTLTGLVSDTPLPDSIGGQLKQTLGGAAASLIPPLGVAVAATAYSIFQAADAAANDKAKASKAAYKRLVALQRGSVTNGVPTPPSPITVLTKYARYTSMVITGLNFPVDATTDGQCPVTVTLTRVVIVSPQLVRLASLSNARLAADKVAVGQLEASEDGASAGYRAEKASGFSQTTNSLADTITRGLR